MSNNENTVNINKYISETGLCSRREADKLIEEGKVKLNGVVAKLGNRVGKDDKVEVNGKSVNDKNKPKRVYIAFNKPIGITCTTDRRIKGNIIEYINYPERIFPIGRLDKPSEGLILLTNDGDIVNNVLRVSNHKEKEYIVSVDKEITKNFIEKMSSGVPIHDTITLPCKVEKIGRFIFRIILVQGLNRQIRYMCKYLEYEVTSLKRVRIMNIKLDNLKIGHWRYLEKDEIEQLNKSYTNS